MHGATYTVDAEFKTDALVEKSNWVVDIGAASEMLASVLSKYNFKNLNEIFPGQNTTTEFMCKVRWIRQIDPCGARFVLRAWHPAVATITIVLSSLRCADWGAKYRGLVSWALLLWL